MPKRDDKQQQSPSVPVEEMQALSSSRLRRRRRSQSPVGRLWKRIRRRIKLQRIIAILLIVIAIGTIIPGILISDALSGLRSAWQSLDRVSRSVISDDLSAVTMDDYYQLQASIDSIQQSLIVTGQRIGLVRPLLNINVDYALSAEMLDVAQSLATASDSMLAGLQPTLDFIANGETSVPIMSRFTADERVFELLELGQERFTIADMHLASAETQLEQLNLNGASEQTVLQIQALGRYHEQIVSFNEILQLSPELLDTIFGINDERSFLLLAQNNDELRPSGGYIGTYGWFRIQNGRIINYDYSPTTSTSPNPPDDNFLEEQNITVPEWWIEYQQPIYVAWDGSWSPHFPTTAHMAMAYYNSGNNPESPVDGVVAIDITGFEYLLDALGQVAVPEYDVSVTHTNFRDLVYDIRALGEGEAPHKEFVAAIYRAIFDEWSSLEQTDLQTVVTAIVRGLHQNHIMVSFADEQLNQALDHLNWSGTQQTVSLGDYLLLADANLGNKSNHSVEQTITYDVTINSDGSLSNRLAINFNYFDDVASQDPAIDARFHGPVDYQSLLQVYLPSDAIIEESSNFIETTTVMLSNYILYIGNTFVQYDSSERYQLRYNTAPRIEALGDFKRYYLLIENQAGTDVQLVNVQVTLPEDARPVMTSPLADANYDLEQSIIDFRLSLENDLEIEIIYRLKS